MTSIRSSRLSPPRLELETDRRPKGVVVVLLLLLAVALYAHGGCDPWMQPVLIVGASTLGVLAALGAAPSGFLVALALVGVFAGLAALQCLPLPMGVVEMLSPERARSLTELSPAAPTTATLSYYALATRRSLTYVLLAGAVFAAIATRVRTTSALQQLLGGIFWIGVLQACLALAQLATEAPGVHWDAEVSGGAWVGSFLNHSNFAQFTNLAVGAGLGLLLVRSSQRRRAAQSRSEEGLAGYFQRNGAVLFGLTVLFLALAASLSRGGALGAAAGGAVVAVALGREGRLGPRSWALLTIPVAVFAGLAVVGFDVVYERLGTLHDNEVYADRWELTQATLRAGSQHPFLGTGLGTHRWVFPGYDTTGVVYLAEQADNDYAQLFEETGLIGSAVLGALVLTLIAAGCRTLAAGGASVRYALYGGLYALVACAVQGVSDFGQRLPAVFMASSALAGMLYAVRTASQTRVEVEAKPGWRAWVIAVGVLAIGTPLLIASWADFRASRWNAIAYGMEERIRAAEWNVAEEEVVDLLTAAEQAAAAQPRDVEHAFWLNAYRWQAFVTGLDPDATLRGPDARAVAQQMVAALEQVRALCPTYGPPHTLEGQIRIARGDASGPARAATGAQLAPHDPEAFYAAALGAATHTPIDNERLLELLTRSVDLSGSYFPLAAALWLDRGGEPSALTPIVKGSAPRLRELATLLEARGAFPDLAAELLHQADTITTAQVDSGSAPAGQVAALAASLAAAGETGEAIALYRQAINKEPANVGWRLSLCDLLEKAGEIEQAYDEARRCFRLRPGLQAARERVEALSLKVGQEPQASSGPPASPP